MIADKVVTGAGHINSRVALTKDGLPRKAFSISETASMLGICEMTVYRLIQRGKLKSSNALRHKLIPLSEIDRFLEVTL